MTTATAETAAGAAPAPRGQLSHGQILRILAGLMLGLFLAALDQTIVATAIRTIGDDLNGLSVQAWVTTAYLITSTITTPLYGKLSDIYGRKPLFLIGISIFIGGSALCSFATSMYMLAGFRALQGLGAGALFTLALAILGDIVSPRERAKYQGYFLAVFGTSSVLGPVIGGFFAGQASLLGITGWRWVFLVNVPVGLFALAVVAKTLNIPHTRREHRLDFLGAAFISLGLVPLLTVAEQGRSWGWGSGRALLCYVVGLVGLVAFVWAESRLGEDALLPLRFFRNRTFSLTSLVGLVVGMGMFGGISSLPLYLQIVRGASPTESGLQLIPFTLGIMTGSVISGQLISRTGRYKIYPIVGSALMIVGMLLLHFITADTAYWQTGVCMLIFGIGLGNVMQPITLAVQNAMPPQDIGVATSSATFFRQMGGTLGVAVFLSILFSSVTGNIKDAFAASAKTPAFQAALRDPAVLADPVNKPVIAAIRGQGGGVGSSAVNDTSFIQHLDAALARPFQVGFSQSMDLVFLVGAGVLVIGFVLLFFLPEIPLRTQSGMAAREGGSPVGGVPDEAALRAQAGEPEPVAQAADQPPGRAQSRPEEHRAEDHRAGDSPAEDHPAGDSPAQEHRVGDRDTRVDLVAAAGSVALPRPVSQSGPSAPARSAGWSVSGHVLGPDGAPAQDAVLTLTDLTGGHVGRVRADAAGRYRLDAPAGGTYLLICLAPDSQPAAALVAVAGADVRRDIALTGASRVTGRVHSDGTGISGAVLTMMDARGDTVGAATSGEDGEYALGDLRAGPYTLAAVAAHYRPAALSVEVPARGAVHVDVEVQPSAVVTGTVRAASDGRALPEATVTLVDADGLVVASGYTNAHGEYRFLDLAPGSYTLTASGYAPVTAQVDVAGGRNLVGDVTLGAGIGQHAEPWDGATSSNGAKRVPAEP